MENYRFSKKIFALLLERAKGERSWRQFALECDISYVQMRKLAQGIQENPPRPKLIKKLANNSFNDIDLEDFMFAAGLNMPESFSPHQEKPQLPETFFDKYKALSLKQKKAAEDFVDFLHEKNVLEQ